jgi:hypothetical protein
MPTILFTLFEAGVVVTDPCFVGLNGNDLK